MFGMVSLYSIKNPDIFLMLEDQLHFLFKRWKTATNFEFDTFCEAVCGIRLYHSHNILKNTGKPLHLIFSSVSEITIYCAQPLDKTNLF